MLKNLKYLRYSNVYGRNELSDIMMDSSSGKGIASKPEDLRLTLETTWWKERVNF